MEWFLTGLFIGVWVGIFLVALLGANDLDAEEYRLRNEALEKELEYWKQKAIALQRRVMNNGKEVAE